ncbi:MAG: phosphotransferase [Bowdeniella nasicola]|nr:phosphotransferase [Bowdeniella nasicola]
MSELHGFSSATQAVHGPRLSSAQRDLLAEWLPGAVVVADLSWGLVDSWVWRVRVGGRDVVVKAGGVGNRHLTREIAGYRGAVAALSGRDAAPRLLYADEDERILVLSLLPGRLALGSGAATDPTVHDEAGRILRILHSRTTHIDPRLDHHLHAKALRWLERPHHIPPQEAAHAREILESYRPRPVEVVPSHGDYGPRNWLVDGPHVRTFDFGRFGHRPVEEDLVHLATGPWLGRPDLREAFFRGYGADAGALLATERFRITVVREAVAMSAWACKVGDEAFERRGLRVLHAALKCIE